MTNAPKTRFHADETGGGTVFSLFCVIVLVLIGGISVDLTNAWRHRQLLQLTADVSSHAGAVALATGSNETSARTATIGAVQLNMPTSIFGSVFEDVATDVVMINYDPSTNTASSSGDKNAVAVFLHRSNLSGSPVRALALNAVNFASSYKRDQTTLDVNAASVAVLAATKACSSSNGIYGKGQVALTSSNHFGAGYCLHSQSDVWMPQQNTFASNAGISMPNLDACGNKCTDEQNPGATKASFETNLILQDLNALILDTEQAFTDSFGFHPEKAEFFADKSIETSALPALEAVGIPTGGLKTGAVVTISESDFESLADIPGGLVYDIRSCPPNGNGGNTTLTIDASNGGDDLKDVAIITNCKFSFGSTANVTTSLLLTTRQQSAATLTANSGANVGEPGGSCSTNSKTYIMALGDMQVPANFYGSNVAIIVDGDIHLSASSSSSTSAHHGVSFHSSGDVQIAANHVFHSCSGPGSGLMPELLVISHVVPEVPASTN